MNVPEPEVPRGYDKERGSQVGVEALMMLPTHGKAYYSLTGAVGHKCEMDGEGDGKGMKRKWKRRMI